MIFKTAGGIAILVTAVYFGLSKVNELRTRLNALRSVLALIAHIKRRIECFREPLFSIYASFDDDHFDSTGIGSRLRQGGLACTAEHLIGLTDSEKLSLIEFEKKLSEYYPADAVRLCEMKEAEFGEILNTASESFKTKAKLYKILPVLAALSVILLMI